MCVCVCVERYHTIDFGGGGVVVHPKNEANGMVLGTRAVARNKEREREKATHTCVGSLKTKTVKTQR